MLFREYIGEVIFLDNKTLKLLEFFYNHDGIRIFDDPVICQLKNNDRDALDFLRENHYVNQSRTDGVITVTRYGREIVELSLREQRLLEIQESNNSIQKRLKFVQYVLTVIALVNVVIAVFKFFGFFL